jgi:acetyl-CoA acetyltransferase
VTADDGIRPGTTAGSLAGLKTVFKRDGTTTAGNSSQVGTCRVLLAALHGLPVASCPLASCCGGDCELALLAPIVDWGAKCVQHS